MDDWGKLLADVAAVGAMLDRLEPFAPAWCEEPVAPESLDLLAEVRRGTRGVALTAREFALLAHFLHHPRQVLTREQLLAAVWEGEDTDDNVVAVYVGYLRAKLDDGAEPRLIQTVRGFGYSLREA